MTNDPIADMLTRIRNAVNAHHATVAIPASKVCTEIARLLKDEGFIEAYTLEGGRGESKAGQLLVIKLKTQLGKGRALSGLRRISSSGLRVYARKTEIPRVLGGLGVAIISTSRGLMTGQAAQQAGLGGEVVAYVW